MKIKFTLSSPLFDDDSMRVILSTVVRTSADLLEADIKLQLQQNALKVTGRVYRKNRITKASTKGTKAIGLRHFITPKGKERAIVGYNFHRASRRGESPATDTGGLIGSVAAAPVSALRSRVSVGKVYGAILDDPKKLNRPFFKIRVDLFKPIFMQKVKEALERK